MKRRQRKPTFNPVYRVDFFAKAQSVLFLDEYPFTFLHITNASLFDLLTLIDGKKSITDLAEATAHRFPEQQVEDILEQLRQKKLVVFR